METTFRNACSHLGLSASQLGRLGPDSLDQTGIFERSNLRSLEYSSCGIPNIQRSMWLGVHMRSGPELANGFWVIVCELRK